VITDVHARYFGIEVNDQSLTPGQNARLGATHFNDWLEGTKTHQKIRTGPHEAK
jgi:hypothetical protein